MRTELLSRHPQRKMMLLRRRLRYYAEAFDFHELLHLHFSPPLNLRRL